LSPKDPQNTAQPKAAKARREKHSPTRRAEDYQTGQVLWTFFVALAVAVAALQHVFSEKTYQFSDTAAAARSPGSLAIVAPERQ